jgi:hypothetical protein
MIGPSPANDESGSSGAATGPFEASDVRRTRADKDTVDQSLDASAGARQDSSSESQLSGNFGRYRISRKLGSGGMGTVYLAHDSQLDRPVALKVPHFHRNEQKGVVERFLREARAMATLRHPNLCPVFDAGEYDGVHYLTMAYIEGELLSDVLKQPAMENGLEAAQVVDIVHKLALALGEAHAAGVIHRDLKPSNIMLDKRGEPIVMDFGLARRDSDEETRLTVPGGVVGTPAYLPPEQLELAAPALGPTSDVYSLGVIFYQLLCGQLPFKGHLSATLAQILTSRPPRPSEIRADVDPVLEENCLKAMSRRPADRFPSMPALVASLEAYRLGLRETLLVEKRERAAGRPAITQNCAHDIFVSYAVVDDEPPPGVSAAGWVTTLAENLEWRLRQLCGHPEGLSVWMDHRLAGNPQFDALLEDRLERTAVVVIVSSPGYVKSAWFGPDAKFIDLLRKRATRCHNVLVVERDRVEPRGLPCDLADIRRFQFWEDRDGQGARIFGYPRPRPDVDIDYYAKIDDLARAVHTSLSASGRESNVPVLTGDAAQPEVSAKPRRGTVYLAEVTDDLDPLRNSVERCLTQVGFGVVPDSWLPREAGQFRQAVDASLKDAVLFVQLLGPVIGKRPPGSTRSYAALQHEAAALALVPVIQWRDAALDPSSIRDVEHRALLESTAVMASDLEQFRHEVIRRAQREFERRHAHEQMSASRDKAFIFVNVDRGDLSLADDLCRVLEQSGCTFALPLHEGRPDEIRRDLEANLLDCDGLIVVYGEITEQWVREQLRQWRKMLYLREKPLQGLAVFEGPPPEKHALGMRFPKMHVIDCRLGLRAEKIHAFLEALAGGTSEPSCD